MGTRCHGIAEVESPCHDRVHESRVVGRNSAAVDKDGGLFLSPEFPIEADRFLAAVLGSAGQRGTDYGQELVLYRLQRRLPGSPRTSCHRQNRQVVSSAFIGHPPPRCLEALRRSSRVSRGACVPGREDRVHAHLLQGRPHRLGGMIPPAKIFTLSETVLLAAARGAFPRSGDARLREN